MDSDLLEKRRSQIMAAAMDAFTERGFHDTKISDIAQRLSMGHGTFYRYFRNKRDIFLAVVDHFITRIAKVVEEEAPQATDSVQTYRDQIRRIGFRLLDLFMEDPRMARIIFYQALGVDPDLDEKLLAIKNLADLMVEAYLVNGVEKGFLKPDLDVNTISKAVNAMTLGAAWDIMFAENKKEAGKRWIETVSLLMLSGMALRG
ncbi:MAG: TetR/AcrR family transcriptional regulator [Deltaproteobacteria bacterium]|nr:TetR/AcrR family transcriptional regulator [Deltaproteobacteria bacterium]